MAETRQLRPLLLVPLGLMLLSPRVHAGPGKLEAVVLGSGVVQVH